jgi:ribose-phosphate pyrophosphokinase
MNSDDFVILTGRANPALAHAIGKILGVEVLEPISIFADGEIRVRIAKNLRRRMVFIIQPTSTPVNDHIMELLFMIDAAKRASASEVTAIIPYYGYGRQDRKEMSRVPISSSVVASSLINAGADRIFTIDIHSEQQSGLSNNHGIIFTGVIHYSQPLRKNIFPIWLSPLQIKVGCFARQDMPNY